MRQDAFDHSLDVATPSYMNDIGASGKRTLLANTAFLRAYQETFYQEEVQTRFYQFPTDAYLYSVTGQVFIENQQQESLLKQNQGIWLKAESIHKVVLLSAQATLLIVVCQHDNPSDPTIDYLQPQSSGTASKISQTSPASRWLLSQHPNVKIELELLPENYQEHLHYHRYTEQFVVNLSDQIVIHGAADAVCLRHGEAYLIPAKQQHRISNPTNQAIQLLSFYTPKPIRDRVLVLKKIMPEKG